MEVTISKEIYIKEPGPDLLSWAREELVLPNPDYQNRRRRGLWTGNTPEYLWLYRIDGETLCLPCGTGKQIRRFLTREDTIRQDLADNGIREYVGDVPLYEYQEEAVRAMQEAGCGILQSPCGSGKTQMGIALAAKLKRKTLWVTHTQELLNQSYDRAAQYYPDTTLGKITAGKVQIGSHMTFATVQTLANLDLPQYQYTWDVVLVDECHRLAGTPTGMTMFYKVLSNLAARYKYGLSATVHRSDGLIRSTFAVLGGVACQVPDEAVSSKTMPVSILRRETGLPITRSCLDTDGTLVYHKLIAYLAESEIRNRQITADLKQNAAHYNLILSDRLEHLRSLKAMLGEQETEACMIDGSMTSKKAKEERAHAVEGLRNGQKHYLFASYALAKEGLDIPRLDRLYLVLPKKDYAVVTQSIGRIARTFDGKLDAICYDYVDAIGFCENQWKKRKTSYRKAGCRFL